MAKRTTKTEVVTKALARSGPEITPEQIRLSDDAQPDKNKVYTQRDYNESVNGGGGAAPDLDGYATTEALTAESHARENGDTANKIAIELTDKEVKQNAEDIAALKAANTPSSPSLPGYKWKLEQFTSTTNPPPNGRMKFNADTNTFYINANTFPTEESVQLARSTHKFNTYEVNGTMLLSIFSEEDGLVYFGKILAMQLKYYNGQTYFELTEANHAVSDLEVGTVYNVTVSGLF